MNLSQRNVDLVDIPNNQPGQLPDYQSTQRRPEVARQAPLWLILAAVIAGCVAFVALVVLFWPIVRSTGALFTEALITDPVFAAWLARLFFVALLAGIIKLVWSHAAGVDRKARVAGVVRLGNDMPVDVRDLRRPEMRETIPAALARHYDVQTAWAEHSTFRNMNTYGPSTSAHYEYNNKSEAGEPALEAPAMLTSESEWLEWTDRAPHIMVAGRTDSGKTTTVEAILARRINAGDLVFVIDPHYQPGKWLGASAVGGGRDYNACYAAFDTIRRLMDIRYQNFNTGTQTENFKRLTVIVDEVPAIIAQGQAESKAMYERWLLFATSLGSEARKVRISVILLTQSPLVRDIGISSAMRDNFTRIALGDTAAELLREEPDSERRKALLDLLRGRPYPAALEYRNSWYALRNEDVPSLARSVNAQPRTPTLLTAPALPAPQVTQTPRATLPPTQPLPQPTKADEVIDLLRRNGAMAAPEIADALGLGKQHAFTLMGDLVKAGRVQRKGAARNYRYSATS